MSASSPVSFNHKHSEDESSSPVDATATSSVSDVLAAGDDTDMLDKGTVSDPMDEDPSNPATVFCIRLKQPRSNLQYKMSVPELCRNFR